MRKIKFLLFFCVACLFAQAQSGIKGRVIDTLANRPLHQAVVMMLSTKDSSLVKFTRTDAQGQYQIQLDSAGRYLLWITYPGFADWVDQVEVPAGIKDMGEMAMTEKSRLLDAVVIRTNNGIRIKGDTTEFAADSFKVREGATVEDLLKVLPGFQVNSNGEIKAGGRTVKKVLVDGEEFFGDDPTMATRNLSARIVDKVQVYDEQTDQQRLRNVSGTSDNTTVNIKLKESEKKGSFGKGTVGTNFGKLVDASLLFNHFKANKKFSAYANRSTVNTGSLSWDAQRKLGMEQDYEYDEISDVYYSFGTADDFSAWSLRGLPDSYAAGGLFSNKWNEDRQKLNLSYRFNRMGTDNVGYTLNQNILPEGSTYRILRQTSSSLNTQHAVNFKYEWKLDSLRSIKLISALTSKSTELYSAQNGEFLGTALDTVNKSRQDRTQFADQKKSETQLIYRQAFKKKDRLLLATFRFSTVDDDQNGTIFTSTQFFKNGVVDSTDIADQKKINTGNSLTGSAKITYNEPLSSKFNLVLDYSYTLNQSESHKNTFNKDGNGKYSVQDPLYSNNFELNVASQTGSVNLRYLNGKFRALAGSAVTSTEMKLHNLDNENRSRYSFLKFAPMFSTSYAIRPQTMLSFTYRGNANTPSINQLQPIRDNTDRLREFVGNPNLKVGFTNNFTLNYRFYQSLKNRGLWSYLNVSVPTNAISYYNYINVNRGTQAYTPINVNGNRSLDGNINIYQQSANQKFTYSVEVSANARRNMNFVEQIKNGLSQPISNRTNSGMVELELGWGYNVDKKYFFRISPFAQRNISKSSLNPTQNLRYWVYGGESELNLELPKNFRFNTNVRMDLRQKIAAFAGASNTTIWNARFGRTWLKQKNLLTEVAGYDLLNQNIGFNRSINSNYITEDRFSRISQYFMFRIEYSFTKTGTQAAQP